MRHYKKKEIDPQIYRVTVRFNKESYEKLLAMAKAANLSAAELIRQMVFKGKVNVKQEVVAEVPMLKKLIADFGKIGSNLNQIATTTTAAVFAPGRCTSAPSVPSPSCTP
jgi:hypothetical protein